MSLKLELQVACDAPHAPDAATFQGWLDRCFPEADDATVVIRIVDATESAALNRQFRGKVGPTNVLSFPFDAPPQVPSDHLGDLVICAPVVEAEAGEQGKPVQHHWAHMLVHGILHLQGYDHLTPEEAEEMETLEARLLALLDIENPYT